MQEYIGFVKAMNALKGMKVCYKDRESSRAWTSSVKVDFDKSKHLSETIIKQRKSERERLIKEERDKEVEENRRRNIEEMQKSEKLYVDIICILIQIIQVKNKHHLNLDKNWMPRNVKEKKRKWQKLWSLHREEWPGEITFSEFHALVDWAF